MCIVHTELFPDIVPLERVAKLALIQHHCRPRHASRPSLTATAAMSRATVGSPRAPSRSSATIYVRRTYIGLYSAVDMPQLRNVIQ
jgi:hypothetical protein